MLLTGFFPWVSFYKVYIFDIYNHNNHIGATFLQIESVKTMFMETENTVVLLK